MIKRLLGTSAVVLAVAAAPAAAKPARTLSGVVVGSHGKTVYVAAGNGAVSAVSGRARIGARVLISAGKLRVVGHARHAKLRGVLIRQNAGVSFVSAAKHVFAIRSPRALAAAAGTGVQPGTEVEEDVSVPSSGSGVLQSDGEHELGAASSAQVVATVSAVGNGTVTIDVNGQQLTISLPAGLTLPQSLVGTQVTLDLSFASGDPTVAGGQDDQGESIDSSDDGANSDQGSSDSSGGADQSPADDGSGDTQPGSDG